MIAWVVVKKHGSEVKWITLRVNNKTHESAWKRNKEGKQLQYIGIVLSTFVWLTNANVDAIQSN